MSVTLLNVYVDNPQPCFFCKQPITDGPVCELLFTQAFTLDETWKGSDFGEPGQLATDMDYDSSAIAHVGCVHHAREDYREPK